MTKRKPFNPIVYHDWADIFKTMTVEQRSEVLMGIVNFPEYEPQGVPLWDFFKEQLSKQVEKFTSKSEANKRSSHMRKCYQSTSNDIKQKRTITNDNERYQQASNDILEPKPIPEPKKEVEEKRTATHELAHKVIPERWKELCVANRPDLDAIKLFNSFRFYWTEGAGSAKRERFKSDRGWNQAWSNWVEREKQGTGQYQSPQPEKESIFNVKHIERLNAARNRIYRVEKEDPIPDFFTAAVAKMGSV